jgi:hypothetical protein
MRYGDTLEGRSMILRSLIGATFLIAAVQTSAQVEAPPVTEIVLCGALHSDFQIALRRFANETGNAVIGNYRIAKEFDNFVLVVDFDPVFAGSVTHIFPRYYRGVGRADSPRIVDAINLPERTSRFDAMFTDWFGERFPCK